MTKYIPDSTLDLTFTQLQTIDAETVCSDFPLSYYEAINCPMWEAETEYSIGSSVKSPTDNNMAYECTVNGISGSTEPAWTTISGDSFSDNTITWKAHNNYSLAGVTLAPADKVISDITGGRKLTIAEKTTTSYRSGTVTNTAFLNSTSKTIEMISTASTTLPANDYIMSGRAVILHEISVNSVIS